MPTGIIPNEGLARGLEWWVDNPDTQTMPWQMMLFVNDIVPDADTVAGDLVEASFAGYSRVDLTPENWSDVFIEDGAASTQWGEAPTEFENTGGPAETVYGFAFYDPAFNVLRYVERFDPGDIAEVDAGDSKFILPRLTRRSEPAI